MRIAEERRVVGARETFWAADRAEMIGTIRGWEATARVGRKTTPGEAAKAAPEAPSWLPR